MTHFSVKKVAVTALACLIFTFALAACSSASSQTYDIGPIFPASPNKCQKYEGKEDGRHCWVSLENCERAAADWENAMKNIPNAIRFKCK